MSDSILVVDTRNWAILLRYCVGRNARTKQRLSFDVWDAADGSDSHELWAGSMDGLVNVWKNPHLGEGALNPDKVMKLGDAPVVSLLRHPRESLVVAATGSQMHGIDETSRVGNTRGGDGWRPKFSEWGRLDLLGFG
jgi:telomerase Cajal body protein 1